MSMKTFKMLVREFWLPFALATVWTVFALMKALKPLNITSVMTIFGPTFFLFSWASGQFIRVRRQSHVESNLQTIQTRLEALLTQLETRTAEIVAQITGGDSFCFVQLMVDRQSNIAQLMAINGGKHPVFDAQLHIADLDCLDRASASKGAIPLETCNMVLRVPVVTPGHLATIGQLSLGEGSVRRFNIFWSARNGDHVQFLRVAKIDGVWQSAIQVFRGNDMLCEQILPNFPRDALGSEWRVSPVAVQPAAS